MDLEAIRARDSAKADLYHEAEIDRRELLKALDECRDQAVKIDKAKKAAAKPKK